MRRNRRAEGVGTSRTCPRPRCAEASGAVPRPAETWLRITQAHDRILRRIDAALRRHHSLSLTAFDALRRISEGDPVDAGAEAAGLARPVQPTTVGRLLDDGLVVAEPGADARRGIGLSPRGRERLAAATATHDDLLGQLVALLGDAAVVTDALARVSRAARPRP